MVASTGVADNLGTANDNNNAHQHHSQPSNGPGPGTDAITTIASPSTFSSSAKKPSHLSIDSNGANSAFLHTLNSQLQMAAISQPRHYQQHHDASSVTVADSDFPLSTGIDRAALIAADFDTDEFLSARRHLPLEELKSQVREILVAKGGKEEAYGVCID